MPSKKPNKPAKKPGKANPKKAARKVASAKKAVRPAASARATSATSKVSVKSHKPAAKFALAVKPTAKPAPRPTIKPAAAKPVAGPAAHAKSPPAPVKAEPKPPGRKASAAKPTPVKFDTRPLVMSGRVAPSEDDTDGEQATSASLLAGPRNVKPYITRRGEQYMNKEQLEHFARILQSWKRDLMVEVDRTMLHMKDEAANFPDPNDRATQEEEFSLELRTRDRERKLIRKIDEALKRIEDGSYGYCLETGEEIGIKRLEARPVATLSVEAQERRERREKQYGDRDDRYR
jgi:DnaK suppressor protein